MWFLHKTCPEHPGKSKAWVLLQHMHHRFAKANCLTQLLKIRRSWGVLTTRSLSVCLCRTFSAFGNHVVEDPVSKPIEYPPWKYKPSLWRKTTTKYFQDLSSWAWAVAPMIECKMLDADYRVHLLGGSDFAALIFLLWRFERAAGTHISLLWGFMMNNQG